MSVKGLETAPSSTGDLLQPGHIVKEKWQVLRKIGHGGFGQIYESKDIFKGNLVAIKSEPAENKRPLSKMEVDVLKAVKGKDHFCHFIGCGRTHIFNYVVMELQGPNLSELKHSQPSNCFSLSTTLRVGHQILQAIEYLHDAGFVHRDIKPSNFAMGRLPETKHKVYMLDFGLARDYLTKDKQLRPPRNACGFRGTVRYASVNAHKNRELGRVDDLWSLFYMLAEFIEGSLPWRRLKDRDQVGAMKECFDHHHLIHRMPDDYDFFLEELSSLTYFDKPHYDELNSMFEKCKQTRGVKDNDPYDWEIEQDEVVLEIFATGTISVSSRSENSQLTVEMEGLEPHAAEVTKKEQKSETENIPASAEINRVQNELNDGSLLRYDNDCSSCQLFAENCSNEAIKPRQVNKCVSKVPGAKQNRSHIFETKTDKYENVQAKLSVPKVSRKRLQVAKTKSQPKVFSSQFAIAEDDISSVQQVTKGGGLALTLVSKWQYSFDYTEAADADFNNDYIENSKQNEFINHDQTKFSSFFTQRDENKVCLASKGKWMMSKKENRAVEKCAKRRRPVRRSVSHPAKIPPNVTVRNSLNDYSNGCGFLRIGGLDNSGQTPQGLPRCWSCPTISLFIRSHLKPPLKQQASFDENVYEVDVMRNVAAKQGVKEEIVSSSDERRTSLPHISITDVQTENIETSSMSSGNKTVPDVLWNEPLIQEVNNVCHKEEPKISSKDTNTGCINHLQRSASLCQKGILKNVCDKYKTNHKTDGLRLRRSRSGPSDMWQKGKVTNVSFMEKKSDPFVLASKEQHRSNAVVPQTKNSIYLNVSFNNQLHAGKKNNVISEGNSSTAFLNEVRDVIESTVNEKIIGKNSCRSTFFQNYFSLDLEENNNMTPKNMNNHCECLNDSPKQCSNLFEKNCSSENINNLEHAPQQMDMSLKNIQSPKQESLIHPTEPFTMESCSLSNSTEKMINISKTLECQKEASEIPVQLLKFKNHETAPIPQIILSEDDAVCEKDNIQPYSVKEHETVNNICIENEHSAISIKQISNLKGSIGESVFQNENLIVTEQENNSISSSSFENCTQNKDTKPVTRRCRENPDCKYVKDESELKLNFSRRRQRPVSVACSSHLPNPYISKHLSDFPSLTNGNEDDNINRLYQKDSEMTELPNELSLQRVSSLPSVPLLNKQLPLYFQDQVNSSIVCQKLPTPPPGEPPLKYCLPSRYVGFL
ncbi:uncharacterized protein LOC118188338 isoform X2 [Stegodyphus dumicola]|nr:uncharacterized protein LOC118188338 isoform X2 [Stegodyphus dumicola]XP_035214643.1 uncharacterized protein LOC118188338 isoform X2 [Stegodyphus dumicola]